MAESIFTTQTPVAPDVNDAGVQYTLGTVFEASIAGTVPGIRWLFPLTLPPATAIGLLYSFTSDGAGVELARANFVTPTAGAWNVATFAAPVAIDPTPARYVAAVWISERYVATNGGLTSAITNGSHLTAPANAAGLRNGRFIVGASPAYPDNGGGALYFADVVFQPAAAGATIVLGQATETDTATPITRSKARTLGQAATADAAAAVVRRKALTLGRALEASTALPLDAQVAGTGPRIVSRSQPDRITSQTIGGHL